MHAPHFPVSGGDVRAICTFLLRYATPGRFAGSLTRSFSFFLSTIKMEGRYLDLLARCLLDDIHGSHDLASGRAISEEEVNQGLIWPARAHTMVGRARLRNIRDCLHEVLEKGIEGDVIETGVWRGGAVIYMKGILAARSSSKKVYVADSFCGLPPPDARYPADRGDPHHTYNALAVARSTVEQNFHRYDLMDDSVRFVRASLSTRCQRPGSTS